MTQEQYNKTKFTALTDQCQQNLFQGHVPFILSTDDARMVATLNACNLFMQQGLTKDSNAAYDSFSIENKVKEILLKNGSSSSNAEKTLEGLKQSGLLINPEVEKSKDGEIGFLQSVLNDYESGNKQLAEKRKLSNVLNKIDFPGYKQLSPESKKKYQDIVIGATAVAVKTSMSRGVIGDYLGSIVKEVNNIIVDTSALSGAIDRAYEKAAGEYSDVINNSEEIKQQIRKYRDVLSLSEKSKGLN
jgi:hypothetical protein